MAVELFANLAETTLASGYTSGGASITVTSASGFPASGTFRVRLGNTGQTIYRVDSIAGAVFTGGAEFNDANATAGDTVKIVASRQVAERWLQSPSGVEVYGATGTSGLVRIGPMRNVVYPVSGDFSWQNQGSAALDTTFGYTRMTCPASSISYRMRKKSAPATPYQVDLLMQYRDTDVLKYGGLFFRESSTSKLVIFQFASTTNVCQVVYFTNETTFNANPSNTTLKGSITGTHHPVALRIRDDGTNLKFTGAIDDGRGRYYFTEASLGRTSFLAGGPNEIGFTGNVEGSASDFEVDFLHWQVT